MSETSVTATAVKEIADLARQAAIVQEITKGDYTFTDRLLHRLDMDPKSPVVLEFYTLAGFAEYLKAEAEDDQPLVHVVSPVRVDAVSKLLGRDGHLRRRPASAVCKSAAMHGFAFNQFTSLDSLAIALQTCFEPARGTVDELRRFCASVRSSRTLGIADDGVSQTVEAKRGIAAVQTTPVGNPWILAPWRTFAEVSQPISPFVLRFREDDEPEAGLYETGDARWQVEAVQSIATFVRAALGPDWTVLG